MWSVGVCVPLPCWWQLAACWSLGQITGSCVWLLTEADWFMLFPTSVRADAHFPCYDRLGEQSVHSWQLGNVYDRKLPVVTAAGLRNWHCDPVSVL